MSIIEERKMEEHHLVWHSAYKNNKYDNNGHCSNSYKNHNWLANTVSFRVKSVTIPNLFPNIYGMTRNLYVDAGGPNVLQIPEGDYQTYAELDAVIQPLLEALVGPTVTVVTDSSGYMSVTSTAALKFYSPVEVYDIFNVNHSLNHIVGTSVRFDATAPFTLPHRVNLIGVHKVRLNTSTCAASRSVHPNGDCGDMITSLSFHNTPHGAIHTFEIDSSENNTSYFREARDCSTIHFELYDDFDQKIYLPDNGHLEVEMIVQSRT